MNPRMTLGAAGPRLWLARLVQSLGWAGVAGIAMMCVAAIVISLAWHAQGLTVRPAGPDTVKPEGLPLPPATTPSWQPLPEMSSEADIPRLLRQLEQAAVSSGLEWRSAEYRVVAETASLPGSLEVRCAVAGAYPRLRSMLVRLIDTVPGFSIRELSVSRPSADLADVEGKLVLGVFLRDATARSSSSDEASR